MRRAALVLLVVVTALPALAQSWYDAYNRGVAAVRAKNYAAGAEALQAAIREVPAENGKLRANREFITYLPHMWLGIARVGLNEPDAALAEFRISEEQGVVQNTPFYGQMREWISQAQQQKKRNAENAAAGSKRDANAAIGRALAAQTDALTAGADRGDAYRAAQRKLQEAIETFNRAGTDVRVYSRAGEAAGQAREMFARAAAEARQAKASRPKPPAPKPKEIEIPFEEPPKKVVITNTTVTPPPKQEPPKVEPPKPKVEPPAPQPPVVSASLAAARMAVQSYRRKLVEAKQPTIDAQHFERELAGTPDEKTVARISAQVAEHERRLEAKLHPPPPIPTPAPPTPAPTPAPAPVAAADTRPELQAAYRAFAGGDFATSESMLTSAIAKAATAEAYVLRGCTRYTRAMLSRTPGALLPSAADDFRTALRMNAALRLGDGTFSPKLVAFFESVRRGK
jgi:tetratricopeptide (TPR) repeat protein